MRAHIPYRVYPIISSDQSFLHSFLLPHSSNLRLPLLPLCLPYPTPFISSISFPTTSLSTLFSSTSLSHKPILSFFFPFLFQTPYPPHFSPSIGRSAYLHACILTYLLTDWLAYTITYDDDDAFSAIRQVQLDSATQGLDDRGGFPLLSSRTIRVNHLPKVTTQWLRSDSNLLSSGYLSRILPQFHSVSLRCFNIGMQILRHRMDLSIQCGLQAVTRTEPIAHPVLILNRSQTEGAYIAIN